MAKPDVFKTFGRKNPICDVLKTSAYNILKMSVKQRLCRTSWQHDTASKEIIFRYLILSEIFKKF